MVDTNLGTFSDTITPIGGMIDQSGIKSNFVSGVTDFNAYFAEPNAVLSANADGTKWESMFLPDTNFAGNVDFDLGASYTINKLAIWNVSLKSLTVMIFDDLNGPGQNAGHFTLSDQTGYVSLPPDVLDFGAQYQGRYVRLAIESEHPYKFGNDSYPYAVIGEVVASVVPITATTPTISIKPEANGDVTINFTGVLQSAGDANGTFEDVPGNPVGTYTIPKTDLSTRQFFRARSN